MKKILSGLGLFAATILISALPASAHVFVSPESAVRSQDTVVSIVVHNDETTGNVNKIDVQIPTDKGLGDVAVHPVPGWTDSTTTEKKSNGDTAVSGITWQGGSIKPGDYEQFSFYVTPLPTSGTVIQFKTIETFDTGNVVRWVDSPHASNASTTTVAGADEIHPTPQLLLTADATPATATSTTITKTSTKDKFIYPSLGLAAIAILLSLLALMRRRKVK